MTIPFYMLLRTTVSQSRYVVHETLKIEGVKVSHSVMGNYDVILYAEGKDIEDLRRIREAITKISDVITTETFVHA